MDTPKKNNYKQGMIISFLSLAIAFNAFAGEKQPAKILCDSYKLPDKLTPEGTEATISDLNQALVLCTNDYLKFRIKYRIGMLYFKASDFVHALDYFEETVQASNCPDLVRLCSLNMIGQIYRIQAKDSQAIESFEKLIEFSQKFLTVVGPNQTNALTVLKLSITAGFAKAEIYQYQQEYDFAITEYKKVIACLKKNQTADSNSYAPLALDRISQLTLIKGDIKGYNQTAAALIDEYSNYYRSPIIGLEIEAVRILKEKDTSVDFARGSFDAPARLITFIKDTNNKELRQEVIILLKNLRGQYPRAYGRLLLDYQYAWLLDAAGQQQEAAVKVLEGICKESVLWNCDTERAVAPVINTLVNYARLQQAMILGEKNKYKDALEAVYSVKNDSNDTHLSSLTDSIEKSLQILKKEVLEDANNQ